jgi:hypothetical protein
MKSIIIIAVLAFCIKTGFAQQVLHVQTGASVNLQTGASLTIQGGALLDNGSTFINNGMLALRNAGTGDWIDNSIASYSYGAGVWQFNNSGNSSITSKNGFARIEVNNPLLILNSDVSTQKWYLISGVVSTGTNRAIAAGNSQLAVEADPANPNFTNSWFNGNLRRFVSPATVNTYFFPLGNNTQSNRVQLDNLNAAPLSGISYIDASFGPKPGTDAGLIVSENGTPYTSVNNGGVWYLTPDATPGTGKYDLLLYFNGFTGLSNNAFSILQRPVVSSNAAAWIVPAINSLPPNGSPGRLVTDGYARRINISSFGQFGIGMSAAALPVTLIDFTATRLSKSMVNLAWQTRTEQNNKGFEIERRLESELVFRGIGFTASHAINGNSTTVLNYLYSDLNSYAGTSYYRLKQIDLDSRSTYTAIKAVNGSSTSSVTVMLWPNPNRGQFTIRVDNSSKQFRALITDLNGRVIQRWMIAGSTAINIDHLSAGTYIISIPDVFGEGASFNEKVLVLK